MSAYPLQHVRGWTFYLKNAHKRQTEAFETRTHWHRNFQFRNTLNPRPLLKYDSRSADAKAKERHAANSKDFYWFYDYSTVDLVRENAELQLAKAFEKMSYEKLPVLPRQFVSFEWNAGRTNNQIMSFEAMLQYALMYQRTILLPFGSHFNHFQGIFYGGLWDFHYLSLAIDFAYEFEIGTSVTDLSQVNVISDAYAHLHEFGAMIPLHVDGSSSNQQSDDGNANLRSDQTAVRTIRGLWDSIGLYQSPHLLWFREFTMSSKVGFEIEKHMANDTLYPCHYQSGIRYGISTESLQKCDLIHLALGRFNHFKIEEIAVWDVMQWFVPAPYIRDAVDEFITARFYTSSSGYRIGVHRRAMKEGGTDEVTGSPYVCRYYWKSASKSGLYARLRSFVERSVAKYWDAIIDAMSDSQFSSVFHSVNGSVNDQKVYSKAELKTWKNVSERNRRAVAILDMYDRTCAMSIEDVGEFVSFHRQQPMVSKTADTGKRGTFGEQFFLATDGQEPAILQNWMDAHGAVTVNNDINTARFHRTRPKWSQTQRLVNVYNDYGKQCNTNYDKYRKSELIGNPKWNRNIVGGVPHTKDERDTGDFAYAISEVDAYGVETAVFDMWTLTKAKFFIGSWHSTLTRTVCHWRGFDAMYTGTNCFLSYKWERVLQTGDVSWFDLGAVGEPKLSWKEIPK